MEINDVVTETANAYHRGFLAGQEHTRIFGPEQGRAPSDQLMRVRALPIHGRVQIFGPLSRDMAEALVLALVAHGKWDRISIEPS